MQKVPSCWDDRDLRQASSSQLRRHFRFSDQDLDAMASETRRLRSRCSTTRITRIVQAALCLHLASSGSAGPPTASRQSWRQAPTFDREAYKQRNTVKREINRLKQWRGIATRYVKTATIYL